MKKFILKYLCDINWIGDVVLPFCIASFMLCLLSIGIVSSIDNHQRQVDANHSVEHKLKAYGFKHINADVILGSYAYNAAELIARKMSDDEFGAGNYRFESTNFNGKV